MKVIKEIFAGLTDSGGGSRKTEFALGGLAAVTYWPEQAWPIAIVTAAFLLARGYQDAAREKAGKGKAARC